MQSTGGAVLLIEFEYCAVQCGTTLKMKCQIAFPFSFKYGYRMPMRVREN